MTTDGRDASPAIVTHPIAGSLDCPHAPHCSAATGCHEGAVPVSWARRVERWGARWLAFTWQHPREPKDASVDGRRADGRAAEVGPERNQMNCPDCPEGPHNQLVRQEDGSWKSLCCRVAWYFTGYDAKGDKVFTASAGLHGKNSDGSATKRKRPPP